jgi:hypothetical protein
MIVRRNVWVNVSIGTVTTNQCWRTNTGKSNCRFWWLDGDFVWRLRRFVPVLTCCSHRADGALVIAGSKRQVGRIEKAQWEITQSVNHLKLWDESVSKVNRSTAQTAIRAQLQRFHDGIERVNTAQTDQSRQETSEQHGWTYMSASQMQSKWAWWWWMRLNLQQSTIYDGNGVFLFANAYSLGGKSMPLLGEGKFESVTLYYIQHEYI